MVGFSKKENISLLITDNKIKKEHRSELLRSGVNLRIANID